jgi:segregation and condensation protein B
VAEAARQLPFEDQDSSEEAILEDGMDDDAMNAETEARREAMRIAEALLFAASEPMEEAEIARRLPEGTDVSAILEELKEDYSGRGVNLVRVARKWLFRTATDLGWLLSRDVSEQKKLSKAALETLAIVAYHQPVTRAEVEDIRGVAISKGTLDVLIETGWVRLRGRRKAPGRPVTYGTTEGFLLQFGLEQITDLPGLDELRAAGLFDGRLPQGFGVPKPSDDSALTEDEDPLDGGDDLFQATGQEGEAQAAGDQPEAKVEGEAGQGDVVEAEAGQAEVVEAEIAEVEIVEAQVEDEVEETESEAGESAAFEEPEEESSSVFGQPVAANDIHEPAAEKSDEAHEADESSESDESSEEDAEENPNATETDRNGPDSDKL